MKTVILLSVTPQLCTKFPPLYHNNHGYFFKPGGKWQAAEQVARSLQICHLPYVVWWWVSIDIWIGGWMCQSVVAFDVCLSFSSVMLNLIIISTLFNLFCYCYIGVIGCSMTWGRKLQGISTNIVSQSTVYVLLMLFVVMDFATLSLSHLLRTVPVRFAIYNYTY